MRWNSKWTDAFWLVAILIVAGVWTRQWMQGNKAAPPPTPPQIVAAVPTTTSGLPYPATPFQLQEVAGDMRAYDPATQPNLFISLTAVGCGECRTRVSAQDRQAAAMLRRAGFPVWNILVFCDATNGAVWQADMAPDADVLLVDPSPASVSLRQYRGSDASCWILIRGGQVVWQGSANPAALRQALEALSSAGPPSPPEGEAPPFRPNFNRSN